MIREAVACKLRRFTLALAVLTMACGGGSPTSPSGGGASGSGSGGTGSGSGGTGGSGGTPNRGTVTATIDGVAYTGAVNAAGVNPSGNLTVASNNSALTLSINFAARAAVGTTDVSGGTTVLNVITTTGTTVIGSWSASALGGSGTLTIATLTSTGASGTFSFTGVPVNTTTPATTKTVINGTFNATF
jgi:hypothetical protein